MKLPPLSERELEIVDTTVSESDARYRGLLEAADAMVVDQGKIVLLNVPAEKQFGCQRALVGQRVINILPKGFAERLIVDDLGSAEEALVPRMWTGMENTISVESGPGKGSTFRFALIAAGAS